VWEATILAQKGRIQFRPDPKSWVEEALQRWPIKEARINFSVAMRSHKPDLPHRDPADRFIAATAFIHGLQLMTVDQRLLGALWLSTIAP
jgi:PIN domain nuclease of toxin-antitoxin system